MYTWQLSFTFTHTLTIYQIYLCATNGTYCHERWETPQMLSHCNVWQTVWIKSVLLWSAIDVWSEKRHNLCVPLLFTWSASFSNEIIFFFCRTEQFYMFYSFIELPPVCHYRTNNILLPLHWYCNETWNKKKLRKTEKLVLIAF